jgi:hypothetical protein
VSTPNPIDYSQLVGQSGDIAAQQAESTYGPLEASTGAAAGQAQQQYQQTVAGAPQPPQQQFFDLPEPQDHMQEIQKVAPFLFAMAALGGKMTGASGMAMLGGLTGMQKGLVQGDQQAYDQARQKYEDTYKKWSEEQRAKMETYQMYLQAYQPRIDAAKIAWEKAEKIHDDVSQLKAKAQGDATTWARIGTEVTNANAKLDSDKVNKAFKAWQMARANSRDAQDNVKVPAGYEKDPDNPGRVRPIPGGPKDPDAASAGGLGQRAEVMFQRVANAGNEAVAAAENIMELPISASKGWFSFSGEQPTSVLDATKNVLANKVTSQDAQSYKVMIAGVKRNLAAIEASGLAPAGSLTESMGAVEINEGDTYMTKLRKMAELRQIVEKGLETNLSNPRIPEPQKKMLKDVISRMQAAIPFTQHDVTALDHNKNPEVTIKDIAAAKGLAKPSADGKPPQTPVTAPEGADEIRAKYKAGKMTKDEALAALRKLGMD